MSNSGRKVGRQMTRQVFCVGGVMTEYTDYGGGWARRTPRLHFSRPTELLIQAFTVSSGEKRLS